MAASYAGPDCDIAPDATVIAAFLSWWFQFCTGRS